MESTKPVIPEGGMNSNEFAEVQLAKDQPEYEPLFVAIIQNRCMPMASRWRLSDEERQIIADGGEIVLQQLTFGRPFQPINLQVVSQGEMFNHVDCPAPLFGLSR